MPTEEDHSFINKSISYLLCNKGIIVNLYKLHFSSFHFSLQPNKRVFHFPTFPPLQPNTQEGKLNIFHPSTFPFSHNFPSSYFSTPSTKRTLKTNSQRQLTNESLSCTKNPNTTKGTHANIVNKLSTILNKPDLKIDLIYELGLLVEPHGQIIFLKINI